MTRNSSKDSVPTEVEELRRLDKWADWPVTTMFPGYPARSSGFRRWYVLILAAVLQVGGLLLAIRNIPLDRAVTSLNAELSRGAANGDVVPDSVRESLLQLAAEASSLRLLALCLGFGLMLAGACLVGLFREFARARAVVAQISRARNQ